MGEHKQPERVATLLNAASMQPVHIHTAGHGLCGWPMAGHPAQTHAHAATQRSPTSLLPYRAQALLSTRDLP